MSKKIINKQNKYPNRLVMTIHKLSNIRQSRKTFILRSESKVIFLDTIYK